MGELLESELLVFVDVNVTLVCIKGSLDVLNCFLQKCDEIKFFDNTIFLIQIVKVANRYFVSIHLLVSMTETKK